MYIKEGKRVWYSLWWENWGADFNSNVWICLLLLILKSSRLSFFFVFLGLLMRLQMAIYMAGLKYSRTFGR